VTGDIEHPFGGGYPGQVGLCTNDFLLFSNGTSDEFSPGIDNTTVSGIDTFPVRLYGLFLLFVLIRSLAIMAIPSIVKNSPLYIRRAPEAKTNMMAANANDTIDISIYQFFILSPVSKGLGYQS
jgi:hypothetical protein